MRTYTEAEVRNLVLEHLGVLPPGETPSAADADRAESAVDAVHARLDGLGLLNWPCCAVPASVVYGVSYMAAQDLVDVFGSSSEQVQRIVGGAGRGLMEIRQQTTLANSGSTTATYY